MPPKTQLRQTTLNASNQDSPKESPKSVSTVKVAPIDKSKGAEVTSLFNQGNTQNAEFNSFKEEMRNMLKEMNKTISNNVGTTVTGKIDALDKKFSNMFMEIKDDIKSIKTDVLEAKSDIEAVAKKVSDIEDSIEYHAKTVVENDEKQTSNLDKAKEEIDTKIEELNQKLLLMEKHDRKYNLLFYGFPEERSEHIFDKFRKVFVNDLGIDPYTVDNMYFVHGHRLPTEKEEGPKPVILRFAHYGDRDIVLSNAYKLAGTKRRILSDLPVSMKKERRRLAKEAFHIRKNEDLQTRIKEKGLSVYLEVRKEKADDWVKRKV